jgi:hypothetical protein
MPDLENSGKTTRNILQRKGQRKFCAPQSRGAIQIAIVHTGLQQARIETI